MTRTTDSDIPFTRPMECLPVNELPESPDWVYELKLDGFRGQGIRDKRGVHLLSRNGKDFSKKFPQVFAALAEALPMGTAVDGELVAFDESGHPSFNAIQNASAETTVVFFVFDVLVNRWRDVKHLALSERLPLLQSAVVPSERVQLSEHFAGPVSRFVSAVRRMGGEGVVAKRLSSHYEPGKRTGAWSKKRLNIGQEFVIGGFTSGSHGIDALVVGFYIGDTLMYAARVRAGLIPATRRELYSLLKPFIVEQCPFANLPESKSGRWGQGLTASSVGCGSSGVVVSSRSFSTCSVNGFSRYDSGCFGWALTGELPFDSDAYRSLETLMCGLLRFAHRVMFSTYILSSIEQTRARKEDRDYVDVSQQIALKVSRLKPETQQKIGAILNDARSALLLYIAFTSMIFMLLFVAWAIAKLLGIRRPTKARVSHPVEQEVYIAELRRPLRPLAA